MDNEQKEALKNLIEENKNQINLLNDIISKLKESNKDFKNLEREFFDFFQILEDSHSKIFFSPYNNYYHVENNHFTKPVDPFIIDAISGILNEDFILFDNHYFSTLEKNWGNKISVFRDEIEEILEELEFIFSDIHSNNSLTKSLDNVNHILDEINKVQKVLEYPSSLSEDKYAIKGDQLFPHFMGRMQPVMLNAPHRIIIIKFDYIFQTRASLITKLVKIIELLKSTNNLIPFSKIIIKKDNGININLSQNQHGEINNEKYHNYGSSGVIGKGNEVKDSIFNHNIS